MRQTKPILRSIFHLVHADALLHFRNTSSGSELLYSQFGDETCERKVAALNADDLVKHRKTFSWKDDMDGDQSIHIYNFSDVSFWCRDFENFIQLILTQPLLLQFEETLAGFLKSIEMKDNYTSGHSDRVEFFSHMILQHFDVPDKDIIYKAALLHDIGKLTLDLSTLNCIKKLTPEQIKLFQDHPLKGVEILTPIQGLSGVLPHVLHHHENFDGSGYPHGLAKNDIPLGSRIIAVVDSFDAMTSDRVYRRSMSYKSAFEELRRFSKIQFDPDIVEIFIAEFTKKLSERKDLPAFLQKEIHGA